ncbi:Hsp20/alpha crystallin family protein [Methylocaldum sp.]|uniref:Hsp20/alpha crystallin family protein n=1 Tax=Methylocaldum sp. TaxID=1969727 RepID=UPI002D5B810C|nr:Hsp20/alpha crystallin family protein [Methylocaldum sp.]HYE35167.1 Hsp20/alpha crystallin family protein [Methylocaldum sp.]
MFASFIQFENSLFDDFRRMEREMDDLFGRWPWPTGIRSAVRGSFPPVNVGATPDKVNVYLFTPGVDPKTLDISIQQNVLTVSGERGLPKNENANYYRQERFNGEFRRAIALPEDVDPDRVEARCENGILHVTVQRREAVKPRQIEIK